MLNNLIKNKRKIKGINKKMKVHKKIRRFLIKI